MWTPRRTVFHSIPMLALVKTMKLKDISLKERWNYGERHGDHVLFLAEVAKIEEVWSGKDFRDIKISKCLKAL